MIIASWNCRGAGNRSFPNTVKDIVREHNIDVLCLMEARISGRRAEIVVRKLGFHNWIRLEASGFAGGIWVLWDKIDVSIELIDSSTQFIHCKVRDKKSMTSTLVTFIYAEMVALRREELWASLRHLAHFIEEAWLVMGDFNSFLSSSDKLGGSQPSPRAMQ